MGEVVIQQTNLWDRLLNASVDIMYTWMAAVALESLSIPALFKQDTTTLLRQRRHQTSRLTSSVISVDPNDPIADHL